MSNVKDLQYPLMHVDVRRETISINKRLGSNHSLDGNGNVKKAVLFLRIWIFFNPQIFFCGFKNFHAHRQRLQIEFARPHVSEFTLSSSANI